MKGKQNGDKEKQRRKALGIARGLEQIARWYPDLVVKVNEEDGFLGDEEAEILNKSVNARVGVNGLVFLGDLVDFTETWQPPQGDPDDSPVSPIRMAALRKVLKNLAGHQVDAMIENIARWGCQEKSRASDLTMPVNVDEFIQLTRRAAGLPPEKGKRSAGRARRIPLGARKDKANKRRARLAAS